MTIRQQGGVFGRNPTFNNVTVDGTLTVDQIVEQTAAAGITLDGVTLKDGNVVLTDGNGIDFSATSGTGTSELFDDYEEGTWTPTFGDWITAPTVVYANYTKIGNQVTVTMYGYDGITNYSSIGGLPFAAASNAVGAGIINGSSSYSIRAGCSVLASATALSGIEAGILTGVYWQLCATYFA